jgi:hypothetical protein
VRGLEALFGVPLTRCRFVPTENLRFREEALTFKVAQPGTTSEAASETKSRKKEAGGGEVRERVATAG